MSFELCIKAGEFSLSDHSKREDEGNIFLHIFLTRDIREKDQGWFIPFNGPIRKTFKVNGNVTKGFSGLRIDAYAKSEKDGLPYFKYIGTRTKRVGMDFLSDVTDYHPNFGDCPVKKGWLDATVEEKDLVFDRSSTGDAMAFGKNDLMYIIDAFDKKIFNIKGWIHPQVARMHCIRNPGGPDGLMTPYFTFPWNTPASSPDDYFQKMAELSLKLQGYTEDQFFKDWDGKKSLDRVTGVCTMMLSMFSWSLPYCSDHCVDGKGKVYDDEEFTDARLCHGGDCEDEARAIVMNFYDFMQEKRQGRLLKTCQDILSEYTPCLAVVPSSSPSADGTYKADSSNPLNCHCIGFLLPHDIASKYTETKRKSKVKGMPVQCLEGTTPMMNVNTPVWKIYGGDQAEWETLLALQMSCKIPFSTRIFTMREKHPFYRYIHDLFFRKETGRCTYGAIPVKDGVHGVTYEDFMSRPEECTSVPSVVLSTEEVNKIDKFLWYEAPIPPLELAAPVSMKLGFPDISLSLKPFIDYWVPVSGLKRFIVPKGMEAEATYALGGHPFVVVRLRNKAVQ